MTAAVWDEWIAPTFNAYDSSISVVGRKEVFPHARRALEARTCLGRVQELLEVCGRSHSLYDVYKALESVHAASPPSWSLDLISGLPHLTEDTWRNSLECALDAEPPHISIYDLQVLPHLPIFFSQLILAIPVLRWTGLGGPLVSDSLRLHILSNHSYFPEGSSSCTGMLCRCSVRVGELHENAHDIEDMSWDYIIRISERHGCDAGRGQNALCQKVHNRREAAALVRECGRDVSRRLLRAAQCWL